MKKLLLNNYFLAVLTGILLAPGWYEWGTGLTMMIAFIPLLILIEKLVDEPNGGREMFLLSSVAIFVWHDLGTWWIKNASYGGMLTSFLASAFYMSIPIWLTYHVRKAWGQKAGLFAFVVFWVAFEFTYIHGEISFPWLILGNGFAYENRLYQWYDITGVLGGSLWVLLMNVFLFQTFFLKDKKTKIDIKKGVVAGVLLVVPIVFSIVKYVTYKEDYNPRKIVVVQPNIDPYLKFGEMTSIEQAKVQVNLAWQNVDSTVDYVLAPETSIIHESWIGQFNRVQDLKLIVDLVDSFPNVKYVTGITTNRLYKANESRSVTASPYGEKGHYFDAYNSAIQIDSTSVIQLYHKSKLVLGAEKLPYPGLTKPLEPLLLRWEAPVQSLGEQDYREVFFTPDSSLAIAPIICYESVFGDYVTDYVKLGAGLIFVLTNDGWWGDTPGYRQHNAQSSLRAVETRRSIARSANTGISAFINQRGDVLQKLGWWKRGALTGEINVNTKLTFYSRHGDVIGRIAFFTAVFMILFLAVKYFQGKK